MSREKSKAILTRGDVLAQALVNIDVIFLTIFLDFM